jgi:hypothetical protein
LTIAKVVAHAEIWIFFFPNFNDWVHEIHVFLVLTMAAAGGNEEFAKSKPDLWFLERALTYPLFQASRMN